MIVNGSDGIYAMGEREKKQETKDQRHAIPVVEETSLAYFLLLFATVKSTNSFGWREARTFRPLI